jgi:hypothetical protein
MTSVDGLRDSIDGYKDTIFAILGFANFYRFDDEAQGMRDDVVVFQGRRLTPSPAKAVTPEGEPIEFVTPDLGVLYRESQGILGEAKQSLPRDRSFWADVLKQLMSYDDNLTGWPSSTGKVEHHDVVLLVHQSRVVDMCEYCQGQMDAEQVRFDRPFAIVSFNRSDQRQSYFHFEKRLGGLSEQALDGRLHRGVQVPMGALISVYSTIKLYDCEPPLPWMAYLIWEHIVARRASDDPKFAALHRNQKVEISLNVDEIVDELHREFSFQVLCPDNTERQPRVPRKAWCRRACEAMVAHGMAKWIGEGEKNALTFYFRKLENVLETMLEVCAPTGGTPDEQLSLPDLSLTAQSGDA